MHKNLASNKNNYEMPKMQKGVRKKPPVAGVL
jgi:hypothetical protein